MNHRKRLKTAPYRRRSSDSSRNVRRRSKTYQVANRRYAEVQVDSAQADLKRAVDMNRRIDGSISQVELEHLRQSVQLADDQLRHATAREHKDGSSINLPLERAEATAKLAQSKYERAKEADRVIAGAVAIADVERLRLAAELARLGVERERARARLQATTPDDPIAELERLRLEVMQLRQQVAALAKAVGSQPPHSLASEGNVRSESSQASEERTGESLEADSTKPAAAVPLVRPAR